MAKQESYMETGKRKPKGLLPVILAAVSSTALAFISALGATLPAKGMTIGAISIALSGAVYAFISKRSSDSLVFILAASVLIVPLAASEPTRALYFLLTAVVAAILAILPFNITKVAAAIAVFGAATSSAQGIGLLVGVFLLFFVVVGASVLSRRAGGKAMSPGLMLMSLSGVAAVSLNEIAKRSTLPGTQLPSAQWLLLAIFALAAAALATYAPAIALLRRAAVPVVTAFAVGAMTLSPLQSTADQLRTTEAGDSILAAIAGSAGSTRMIGDEGAGPRAKFKGIDFDDCDKFSIRDCLITYFDEIANKDGVQAAIDDVVSKVQTNTGSTFPTHCHQVIHNLGQLAFELTGGDFALVSSYDPGVCGTGFIHGLYERYFNRYGSYIFTNTGDVCKDMNLIQQWYAWTCNHILGHIISTKMINNPNVAAEFCLQLLGKTYFPDCNSGAWMNFWSDDLVGEYFGDNFMNEPEEVFKVCYGATREVKFYCYQEIFPVLAKISGMSLPTMAGWCQEYAEPARGEGPVYLDTALDYSDRCMQGVARAVAVVSGYDYRVATIQCSALPGISRSQCLSASAASIVLNTGSVTAGMEMCERVDNKGYRDYCYIWVKQVATMLSQGPNSDNMPKFGETRTPSKKVDVPLPPKVTQSTNS